MEEVKMQADRLREITAQAMEEIGCLARGLHPTVLDDLGLGVALSRYAADYTKIHNIDVDLNVEVLDSCNLSSMVQITLYRILQEALTNVARHSGAKKVIIHFTCVAESIEVAIIDDGYGFNTTSTEVASPRLGIHGMRERAVMLGGTVKFVSQHQGGKHHGTTILVRVPLAD
jgi:signal transduction histidine kinase